MGAYERRVEAFPASQLIPNKAGPVRMVSLVTNAWLYVFYVYISSMTFVYVIQVYIFGTYFIYVFGV